MNTKKCPECLLILQLTDFNKNKNRIDGVSWSCKSCISIDKKSRYCYSVRPSKEQVKTNKIKYKKKWYLANRERVIKKNVARQKEILKTNPKARMIAALRARVRQAIKNQRSEKAYKTISLTGCSLDFLRRYLEEKFVEGMTWENYGRGHGKWNIDHIKPVVAFDLSDPEEQKRCFHYTNLQPLWFYDNMKKGTKISTD